MGPRDLTEFNKFLMQNGHKKRSKKNSFASYMKTNLVTKTIVSKIDEKTLRFWEELTSNLKDKNLKTTNSEELENGPGLLTCNRS